MRIARYGIWITAAVAAAWTGGCQQEPSSSTKAIDYYVNAQMHADKEDYETALAELRRAINADPSMSVAYTAAGDIYRKQGDYEMAKRNYESAVKANPYAFKPHYNLGVVYQALSEAAKTVDAVQEYLTKAVKVYLRALTIKSNDFDANLNLSVCYFELGKDNLAEQYCKTAIELDPRNAAARSNLGLIYDFQGQYSKAIAAYNDSLELDSHQPRILLNLGSTYMRQQRWARAIHAFELAAAEMPGDSAPFEQIGACRFQQNELDLSAQAYAKAVELNGKSAAAHRGLGIVLMTQFNQDRSKTDLRDKALEAWHRSLELRPTQDDLVKLIEKYQPKPKTPEL
ncbi:MAG: tetratricopeptide repeat protein [Phycisphaerae bacterium]